eukprot:PLAT8450.1.p1 GENE.PLAT8450.1~~PLAT8450.1.p1  ORF type:complete len:591 (-),score=185.18 PLAT8450.1:26-1798(-)
MFSTRRLFVGSALAVVAIIFMQFYIESAGEGSAASADALAACSHEREQLAKQIVALEKRLLDAAPVRRESGGMPAMSQPTAAETPAEQSGQRTNQSPLHGRSVQPAAVSSDGSQPVGTAATRAGSDGTQASSSWSAPVDASDVGASGTVDSGSAGAVAAVAGGVDGSSGEQAGSGSAGAAAASAAASEDSPLPALPVQNACSSRFAVYNLAAYSVVGAASFTELDAAAASDCEEACCNEAGCGLWLWKAEKCSMYARDDGQARIVQNARKGALTAVGIAHDLSESMTAGGQQWTVHRGLDIAGNDVARRISSSMNSAADCAANCARTKRCNAWTLVKQHCWLKSVKSSYQPQPVDLLRRPSFISGWKASIALKPFLPRQISGDAFFVRERFQYDHSYERNHIAIEFVSPRFGTKLPQDARMVSLKMLLRVVDAWFKRNKLVYWLDASTLLGAVRDKELIPWDEDLDFGVPAQSLPAVMRAAENDAVAPGVLTMALGGKSGKWNVLKFIDRSNGVYADVFTFPEIAGHVGREHRRMPPGRSVGRKPRLPRKKWYPLAQCKLYDGDYPCPKDSEAWLSLLYTSGWRQPQHWH